MSVRCRLYLVVLFLISVFAVSAGNRAYAESPVLYHSAFEDYGFLEDDILEHAEWKTIEERQFSLTKGRFGKALHLGAVPKPFDLQNASALGMNMYSTLLRRRLVKDSPNWVGPFIWSGDKINPSAGSVSFWIKGELTPEWKLFYQTTSSFGRVERDLIVVRLDHESRLSGYVVDARYDSHEIKSERPVSGEGWKHIVFTWDMTAGMSLYLDGERVASNRGEDAWWMTLAPGIMHLPSGGCTYDELYIFDRPLSDSEVKGLYASNSAPKASGQVLAGEPGEGERLMEKSGISSSLDLPSVTPSNGRKTLVFKDLWNPDAADGHVPGWWVNDGRYVLAWPQPYAFWTITVGDMDFHAQKVDLGIPEGETVNYVTLEGNLEGLKMLALEDSAGLYTTTLLDVPPDHGFFYGTTVKPVSGKKLRIPFVKGWGTPPYYKGDVNLPLTGATRLHEVGLFNVSEGTMPSGRTLYLSTNDPGLDKARYGFALKSLGTVRDTVPVSASDRMPKKTGQYIDTGSFRRMNVFSEAFTADTGVSSITLNLSVRSEVPDDVLLVRVKDPAVPSRIWSHAEVKLDGFDAAEPRLLSLTIDVTDIACPEGDRLWIDICSAYGTEILVGDRENPSHLIVETMPVSRTLAEYSPREIYAAQGEFSMSQEYPLWLGKVHDDFLTPRVWSGIFDKVYPVAALRRVDPDYPVARYLWDFASGRYYYSVLRDLKTGEMYTQETYPDSLLVDIEIPDGVPAWAAYMRAYRELKLAFSNHWIRHQNEDGQFGGGYNDDTTHMTTGEFDSLLDGNQTLLDALNKCRDGFDRTGLYQDGYQVLYPMDRHHTRDPVRQYQYFIAMNLGRVHQMEYGMNIAWHYEHPERTPMHYSDNIPFVPSWNGVNWYWGILKPEEPYIGPDEKTLTDNLRYWYSRNDSTMFWHNTRSYKEFGCRLIGTDEFVAVFVGKVSGTTFPGHAISWPKGGGTDVSRWVEYADGTSLKLRMYSFDSADRDMTMRLYRLNPGKYSLILAPDRDGDGEPDSETGTRLVDVRRFSDIGITVPPRVPVVLRLTQVEDYGEPGPLPDLAIDPEDIRVNGTFVTVTVHNIGNAPVSDVPVTLYADGKAVETKTVEHIDAPVDFIPKAYTLYFDYRSNGEQVGAVVDPDNTVDEIFELNNSRTAADCRGNEYFDWSDMPYVP